MGLPALVPKTPRTLDDEPRQMRQLVSFRIGEEEFGVDILMVQEIIPGDASEGVNYNSYCAGGEAIAEFTSEKVRIDPVMCAGCAVCAQICPENAIVPIKASAAAE